MTAKVNRKFRCDCKRCATLPGSKMLGKSQLIYHRRIYGLHFPLDSATSTMVYPNPSPIESNLSRFFDTEGDSSWNFPDDEDQFWGDEEDSLNEENEGSLDLDEERDSEEELEENELDSSENEISDDDEMDDREESDLMDEDADMEIKRLMSFSGTLILLFLLIL